MRRADDRPANKPTSGLRLLFRSLFTLIGLAAVAAWPIVAVTAAAGVFIAERRLVRQRWWSLWTILTFIAGTAAAGGLIKWTAGIVRAPTSELARITAGTVHTLTNVGVPEGWLTKIGLWTWPQIIAAQMEFSIPTGLLIAAVFNLSRLHGRRLMGQIEGPGYSNIRPPGRLDRARATRNLRRGANGDFTEYDPRPWTARDPDRKVHHP